MIDLGEVKKTHIYLLLMVSIMITGGIYDRIWGFKVPGWVSGIYMRMLMWDPTGGDNTALGAKLFVGIMVSLSILGTLFLAYRWRKEHPVPKD